MVLVTLMWSIAGVVTRQLEATRSFEATFWRSFFTVCALLVILPTLQGRAVFARARSAGAALWLSGICWGVMFTAFMLALTLTTVANVLITLAIGPFLTTLFVRVFIGYRIPRRTLVAIVMAAAGIGWMYAGDVELSRRLTGTLLALLVPIASAGNWTIVQLNRTKGRNIDLVPAVLIGAALSSLATLPLALPFLATTHDLLLLALLGLVQLAIPCALSVLCAGVLKAPEIALLALLEILFGILLAWLGADEVPGAHVLSGGILVIAALVVNELIGWKTYDES